MWVGGWIGGKGIAETGFLIKPLIFLSSIKSDLVNFLSSSSTPHTKYICFELLSSYHLLRSPQSKYFQFNPDFQKRYKHNGLGLCWYFHINFINIILRYNYNAAGNYWTNSPAVSCAGLYKLESRENEDDLLRLQGFPWLSRKIVGYLKPSLRTEY